MDRADRSSIIHLVELERSYAMLQKILMLNAMLMVALTAAWVGGGETPAFAKPALVEVTGQTTS
jgi:hypothetical protein